MPNFEKRIYQLLPLLLAAALIFLTFLRIQVALYRFLDIDEFTHLRWAAQIYQGEKPYLDFFTFFPPGYHWVIQPLFWLFNNQATIFLAGRIFGVFSFLFLACMLGIIFGRLRSWRFALLPVVILAFLPMPYDKFFEIRPDTLSTALGFLGVILFSLASRETTAKRKNIWFAISGFVFAWVLWVLPKMLPFVMIAGFVLVGRTLLSFGQKIIIFWQIKRIKQSTKSINVDLIADIKREILPFVCIFAGGALAGIFFFLWMLSLGDFSTVWYSLTKLGIEGNKIGKYFIMEPHLFFFPNTSFYGGEGYTFSYIINHLIWLLGMFVGTFRLVTPVLTTSNGKTRVLDELMMAGIFIMSLFGYIYFFPLKHTQYLIPIAVFIAFYAADGLIILFNWINRQKARWLQKGGNSFLILTLVILVCLVGLKINIQLNHQKMFWKNTSQLQEFELLQRTIPKDAVIADLEGKAYNFKNGYFVCCLAFGQFGQFLTRPLPNFTESLVKNNVTYIYQGDSGRLTTIPYADYQYVLQNYKPMDGWYNKLWIKK